VLFVAALVLGLRMASSDARNDGEPAGRLLGDAPDGTVAAGVRSAWRDVVGLGIALLVGFAIFAALFTTLFTNLHGLATATFATDGTLLYWLGQHEVQRGNQPWFYYLVLMPQYEFIGFLFGFGVSAAVVIRAIGSALGAWSTGRNLFFRGLLVTWFLGIFAGISYAGEKMPWLIIHAALPAAVLAGMVIGAMIERGIAFASERRFGRAEGVLFGALLLGGAGWIALAALMTRPEYARSSTGELSRTPTSWAVDNWWLLAIGPLLALLALAVFAVWRGPQRAALATAAALVIGLLIAQVHVGGRMTYFDGDVPRDMLIYTQTSPDIPMVIQDLGAFSRELYGDKSIEVMYDSRSAWPLQWYLRDFTGRRYMGSALTSTPTAPALLISDEQFAQFAPFLDGYTSYDYVLRWWFPESMYRQFAIAPELRPGSSAWTSPNDPHGPLDVLASVFESIGGHDTPAAQQELYRLLMYRDLTERNGQYGFKLLIRNDLLPIFNGIRY
jgi:predicted membrane-bound mannosyltransferase